MRISRSTVYALGVSAAVAILAGCSSGGSQSALAPPGTVQQSAQHLSARSAHGLVMNGALLPRLQDAMKVRGRKHAHGDSFIKHMTKTGQLAYVSDPGQIFAGYPGYVYIYAWNIPGFTRGTFMGQLAGPLVEPTGVCVDKNQNVYVADFATSLIWKYAWNDVIPIGVLPDPGNNPLSCSVDKTTGNVAVTNLSTTNNGSGSVYVYPGGSADWVPYYNIGAPSNVLNQMWFAGYDTNGNLFADGCVQQPPSGCTLGPPNNYVVELPKGADEFVPIGVQGVGLTAIQVPGQIQWDGAGNLDVGDGTTVPGNSPGACIAQPGSGCGALYATVIKPTELKQEFVTNFIQSFAVRGSWTQGTRVIVPNILGNGWGFPGACLTPAAPSVTCTLVYYYGMGVSAIAEWDFPYYQLEPWGATVSK
jgi:hypothetical protein